MPDLSAALAALLKAARGPLPPSLCYTAAAFMLEPYLLAPRLSGEAAREWARLTEFGPSAMETGWLYAVANHRGSGRLVENLKDRTWGPGPGLDAFETAGWPDDRARFVLRFLEVSHAPA